MEDLEEKMFNIMCPLFDHSTVKEAREILDQVRELKEKARKLLKTVPCDYEAGQVVEHHRKRKEIMKVEISSNGQILLTLRRLKKDGTYYRHPNANSDNAGDITVNHYELKRKERAE